ncbi:hypothetical protein O7614_11685 [Micromonospora sp. WMMD961]|uniref:hypothetical protein n=1 Tax=Micromonospora sp. WMMD961 TaxID=3016100 RepID=UPI002415F665|nr:hypothetical protein [Micromonospora sp. WMMD961]MDG4780302.1 hypothetical protein [Micromonospora sp. WMMD961]
MLPVAFTCPLWWVARWATRVLTSLAVVAALALGAGPASAAVPPPFALGALPASCPCTCAQEAVHEAQGATEGPVEEASAAWSVAAQPAPPEAGVASGSLPVRTAGSDRLPLVHGPSGRAPRAPPGR